MENNLLVLAWSRLEKRRAAIKILSVLTVAEFFTEKPISPSSWKEKFKNLADSISGLKVSLDVLIKGEARETIFSFYLVPLEISCIFFSFLGKCVKEKEREIYIDLFRSKIGPFVG